jgi:hypothetical protein
MLVRGCEAGAGLADGELDPPLPDSELLPPVVDVSADVEGVPELLHDVLLVEAAAAAGGEGRFKKCKANRPNGSGTWNTLWRSIPTNKTTNMSLNTATPSLHMEQPKASTWVYGLVHIWPAPVCMVWCSGTLHPSE